MTSAPTGKDPGWNDPPTFTYDTAKQIQEKAGKKGLALNKRVAFPLTGSVSKPNSGGIDPTTPPCPINIEKLGTPPVGSPPKPIVPSLPTSENSSTDLVTESEDRLNEVMENFGSVHNLDSGDEISKRIKIMEKIWKAGKFDSRVKLRLLELSESLRKGDVEVADHAQKSLMVDYVSVCSTFMGGIRQLINLRRGES